MVIEIRGTEFVNKGAELMLLAIISKIREVLPKAKLVMAPNIRTCPYINIAELGIYQKIWLQRYSIQWGYISKLIPSKLRKTYGMVLDSEVDIVLDASGFAYSDQWGPRNTILCAKATKRWKKQGTKVIFMPQAFGPFTSSKIRNAFKTIAEHADLIYAREKISLNYITELTGEREHLHIAPDFTNLIEGELPLNFDKLNNRFCIIPNYKMINKTSRQESENYIPFLVNCCRYLYDNGAKPFILIHEGDEDLALGREVVKQSCRAINVIQEDHALGIKGIIGASDGVISSRFHGLVSALSQGIPALAAGWSHKYKMLFEDYNFTEGLIPVTALKEDIERSIRRIIDLEMRFKLVNELKIAAARQKDYVKKMWYSIFNLIQDN